VVKQICFYADEVDEAQFAGAVAAEGAVFLPSLYPRWPFPILHRPLPPATEPYMARVVVWHPEIFRESEMLLPGNRPYNPAGKFYLAHLWPVLELLRPHPVNRPVYWASLRFDAWYASFRFGRPVPQFSPEEVEDFRARAAELERLYRRLCVWVRRRFARMRRGVFCGPSVGPRLPELYGRAAPNQPP
jgi:hypothetical protein